MNVYHRTNRTKRHLLGKRVSNKRKEMGKRIMMYSLILFSFVSIFMGEMILIDRLVEKNEYEKAQEKLEYFRSMSGENEPLKFEYFLKENPVYKKAFDVIKESAICFPVANKGSISYSDSWGGERTFLGNRTHEGCDLMSRTNIRGEIPVFSMSDGVLENKGWLTLGGWRLGIRTKQGVYFYYAHLYSYAESLEVGKQIKAGQFLGFMGDSGYGEEGTIGQFDVHLHLGIYLDNTIFGDKRNITKQQDISVNPYWVLKMLEREEIK